MESPNVKYAEIGITRDMTTGAVSYEWIGSPRLPIRIDERFIKPESFPMATILVSGPMNWTTMVTTYVRADAGYHRLYHWLVSRWMKHCRAFSVVEVRLILTFHLWGIGYTHANQHPSWGNLAKIDPMKRSIRL